MRPTTDTLNGLVEFDCPFVITADGSLLPSPEYAPEGVWDDQDPEGWTLLTGYTGQYGYNGPTLHPSEFLGGGLALHVLDTPGTYCLLVSYGDDDDGNVDLDDLAGWCIAYHE